MTLRLVGGHGPSWQGGKAIIACLNCKREFRLFPSQVTQRSGKFCSRACMTAYRRGRSFGESNPNWRGGKPLIVCKWCNRMFPTRQKRTYCSNACFYAATSDRNHPRWKTMWGSTKSTCGKRQDLNGIFFRSSWEANYARYLTWMLQRGQISAWDYEAETFEFHKIKRGTRFYTPDFRVTFPCGTVEYHEVKGYRHPKGETALKRMAKYYPKVTIVLIDKTFYYSLRQNLSKVIPNWE